MRYILWVAALLEAWDVIQDGNHFGCHLCFYRKLEIVMRSKTLKIGNFRSGHVEYDRIKTFFCFLLTFLQFSPQKGKKHDFFLQKWLDHLLLMSSYLVTIATGSHQT